MKLYDIFDLELDELFALLKKHNISSLSVGDCAITLSHDTSEVKAVVDSNYPDELQKLSCGHALYEANELGECLHGCLPTEDTE